MGGLVAALGTTARPALDRAALAHRGGSAGALEHGHGAIAAVARAGGACVERSDGALAAVDGRLDDRDGLSAAVGCRGSDAALVLGAWRRWGPALVDHVRGDLALVVVTRDGLLAARPPCATRPLFAARTADGWFAATELAALPAEARSTVDEARVAGWLIRDFREDTRTFFAAARRVPPGAALWWTARGEQWRRAALADVPEPADPVAAVREALERSVERRLQGAGPTAALVSGGLDSSTVGALAARRGVTDALCATFDGYPEADERSYARQASAAAGLTLRELPAAGLGQLSDAAAALSQADEPPDLSHLAMHAALIDGAAALGATTLLTGTGGDYVASHGHARLTELARRGRIDLALAEIRALVRAGYPGTARDWLTTWVLRPAVPERALALRRRLTGADAVRRPAEWIRHDFANAHDLPSRVRTAWQQWTRAAPDARTEHRRLLDDPFHSALADALEQLGARRGVAVRFPWMDRDLVETCLAVPASWKLGGGHTRRVVRAAAADLLPPSVQNRPTKANFSRVFHDGLRRDHAEIDAATADLDALRFAVDPDALRAACRNYLAGDDRAWRAPWTAVVLGGFLARRA